MRRSILVQSLLVCSLLTAVHAQAEVEYWVAVGSYKDLLVAEDAQREASAVLPESFSISHADTPSGFFYRVLAGPYLTREIADHMQNEAMRLGFEGAWMLAAEAGSMSTQYSGITSFSSSESYQSRELDFDTSDYTTSFSEPGPVPRLNDSDRPEKKAEHTLVNEAPADYRLNRLRRDDP
jgi:hypothetical protein